MLNKLVVEYLKVFKESIIASDDDWTERLSSAFNKLNNSEKQLVNDIISILYADEFD